MRKKILISNDDGINGPGLLAAKNAVEDLGEVTVVAPNTEHSGLGRCLNIMKPLKIYEKKLSDGSQAYSVDGTPSDAVNIGINHIMKDVDLVICGINLGRNITQAEISKSGTVGAAIEAITNGINSISASLSIDMKDVEIKNGEIEFIKEPDFSFAEEVLHDLCEKILYKGLPDNVNLLNLNVPPYPSSKDIVITSLADKMFTPSIIIDEDKENVVFVKPNMIEEYAEGTDGYVLLNEKKVSLTPLKVDITGNLESLKKW